MAMLGPNLNELYKFCERQFTLKTILMIAIQSIDRIEQLHSLGYLHRDIKPQNICIGGNSGKKANTIHLIDFGLVKRFRCPNTGTHFKPGVNRGPTGTVRWLSKNAHKGNEHCRADDLISLGYMFVWMYKGHLPWDECAKPKEVYVDPKDPKVVEKTMEYEKSLRKWRK